MEMDMNWKKWFSYFKFYFLLIGILAVAAVALTLAKGGQVQPERANQECTTTERVFDYADVLTDGEEEKLRELISQKETETGCDIVLVTLRESLEEYARSYEDKIGSVAPYQYTMVYADNFYDEHKFGYNKPWGDGVILVDNWFREADGKVYSWLSTCGKAEDRFSGQMIDSLLDRALEHVDSDPYGAYKKYVELFADYMDTQRKISIPVWAPLLAALVAAVIFVSVQLKGNSGKKTVNAATYAAGGRAPRLRRREDIFLRKTVSRRRIERNNSSGGGGGGGGHHVSSGGVSHGGGGHSR